MKFLGEQGPAEISFLGEVSPEAAEPNDYDMEYQASATAVLEQTPLEYEVERIRDLGALKTPDQPMVVAPQEEVVAPENYALEYILGESSGDEYLKYIAGPTNDVGILTSAIKVQTRMQMAERMMLQAIEESEGKDVVQNFINNPSLMEGLRMFVYLNPFTMTQSPGVEFTDFMLRAMTLGSYTEDITKYQEKVGRNVLNLASGASSDEEFKQKFGVLLEEWKSEGILTSENLYQLEYRYQNILGKGYDKDADLWQNFAIFDLVTLGAPLAKAAVKGIRAGVLRATHPYSLAGNSPRGSQRAAQAASAPGGTAGTLNPRGLSAVQSSALNPGTTGTTNTSWSTRIANTNVYLRDLRTSLARSLEPSELITAAASRALQYNKGVGSAVLDYNFTELGGINRFVSTVDVGTSRGLEFPNKGLATAALNRLTLDPGTQKEIVQGSTGFRIRLTDEISQDVAKLGTDAPTGLSGITSLLSRPFASASSLDAKANTFIASRNEGIATKALKDADKNLVATLGTLSKEEKLALGDVIEALRDSPRKTWLTEQEFISEYTLHAGKTPSQKAIDTYHTIRDYNDMSIWLEGSRRLVEKVRKGYARIVAANGDTHAARVVPDNNRANIGQGEGILDLATGNITGLSKLEGQTVYELANPLTKRGKRSIKYATKPRETKLLQMEDVIGYNAGPWRLNPRARYFITVGDGAISRAILTAFSPNEAQKAVKEMQALQQAAVNGNLTDAVVRANNNWNPDIMDVQALRTFADDYDWDLTAKISYKERDGQVEGVDLDSFYSNYTNGEFFAASRRRTDVPLKQYGGQDTFNVNPLVATAQQLSSAVNRIAFNSYNVRAVHSLVRQAQAAPRHVVPAPAGIGKDDVYGWFNNMEIKGSSPEARKLANLRRAILNRTLMKSQWEQDLDRWGGELKEFVFDKTGKQFDAELSSAERILLNLNFQSTMGLLNMKQVILQASHVYAATAVSPINGLKAVRNMWALSNLTHVHDPAALKLGIQRLANTGFASTEDISFIVNYMKDSGRQIVDLMNIEQNVISRIGIPDPGGATWVQQSQAIAKNAADVGLTPFKTGELITRKHGIITAVLDWRQANPTGNIFSDKALKEITLREQNLTFNMTTASRSQVQTGITRLPLQWTSYSFRAVEAIATGRSFTPMERARLGLALGPLMGIGYMAWGNDLAYEITEFAGYEPDSTFLTTIKDGVLDGFLEYTGVDAAIGQDLSLPNGLWQLYSRFAEIDSTEDALAAIAGPVVGVTGGITINGIKALADLFSGRPSLATEDLLSSVRGIASVDNVSIAYGILMNGHARNRSGTAIPLEMDAMDAAIFLAGFNPKEYQDFLQAGEINYYSRKDWERVRKDYSRKYRQAVSLLISESDDDRRRGSGMIDEINFMIQNDISMSNIQRTSLLNTLNNIELDNRNKLIDDLLRRGRVNEATRLQQRLY